MEFSNLIQASGVSISPTWKLVPLWLWPQFLKSGSCLVPLAKSLRWTFFRDSCYSFSLTSPLRTRTPLLNFDSAARLRFCCQTFYLPAWIPAYLLPSVCFRYSALLSREIMSENVHLCFPCRNSKWSPGSNEIIEGDDVRTKAEHAHPLPPNWIKGLVISFNLYTPQINGPINPTQVTTHQ